MFTPEQINELLEQAKPSVIESLKNDLRAQISWDTKNTAGELVRKHVTEWVQEQILPEVTKQLIESKESLVSLGVCIAPALMEALTKAFTDAVSESLKSSWQRKKVFDALLNG
jgi:hypothetical protein